MQRCKRGESHAIKSQKTTPIIITLRASLIRILEQKQMQQRQRSRVTREHIIAARVNARHRHAGAGKDVPRRFHRVPERFAAKIRAYDRIASFYSIIIIIKLVFLMVIRTINARLRGTERLVEIIVTHRNRKQVPTKQ
jgi:hypothetical protein